MSQRDADQVVLDTEREVVGILLHEPAEADRVAATGLHAEHFLDRNLAQVYGTVMGRHQRGLPIDPTAVAIDLPPAVVEALEAAEARFVTGANAEYYAARIVQEAVKRRLARELRGYANALGERGADADELVSRVLGSAAEAEAHLAGIEDDDGLDAMSGLRAVTDDLERAASGDQRAMQTGIGKLDRATGGLHPGDIWIVAARPSMGKSLLGAQLAATVAAAGQWAMFASFEMPSKKIWRRLVSAESGLNSMLIRDGSLSQAENVTYTQACNRLVNRLGGRLRVYDRLRPSIEYVLAAARRQRRRGRCDLLVLDFAQRLHARAFRGDNRNAELERISRLLADFAREHQVAVILLSQLNRLAEGHRPTLAMLRDSGSLEQDADVVAMIHGEADDRGNPVNSKRDLVIEKSRDGVRAEVQLHLDADRLTFHERIERKEPTR
jgi:replicative DNA helicase